jgi:hypothetical protein
MARWDLFRIWRSVKCLHDWLAEGSGQRSATVCCPGCADRKAAEYIGHRTSIGGSSGGGLFDDRGNLIGITTFTVRDSQGLTPQPQPEFWR